MRHVLPSFITTHVHHETPLSHDDLESSLDAYLSASQTKPHLHPDSILTPAGVSFSATSGPSGNIQIKNLQRILAGLRGEELAIEPDTLLAVELLASQRQQRDEGDADGGENARRRFQQGRGLEGIGRSRDRGTPTRPSLKKGSSFSSEMDGTELERVRRRELNGGGTELERVSEGREGSEGKAESGIEDSGDEVVEEDPEVAVEQAEEEEGSSGEWQDGQEFARSRDVLEGEVGEREGAPVVKQGEDADPPILARTDKEGKVKSKGEKLEKKKRVSEPESKDTAETTSKKRRKKNKSGSE